MNLIRPRCFPPQASVDQSSVDLSVPGHMGMSAFAAIQLLGIVAVMSQVAWQVFIVFIPVAAVCIWYQVTSSFLRASALILGHGYPRPERVSATLFSCMPVMDLIMLPAILHSRCQRSDQAGGSPECAHHTALWGIGIRLDDHQVPRAGAEIHEQKPPADKRLSATQVLQCRRNGVAVLPPGHAVIGDLCIFSGFLDIHASGSHRPG